MSERVGIAGLSPAAVLAAAAAAERGARVIAFDDRITLTAALRRGEAPVEEPERKALIERTREQINYTATAADLSQCDIVYLFVDAIADDKGRRDESQLKGFFRDIAAAARSDAILVVVGDVPPGYTRAHAPKGRSVFYQSQAPGVGTSGDGLRGKWQVVGCADPAAPLPESLAAYLETFGCPVLPVRYESAELARAASGLMDASAAVTATFLVELCEKAGADWGEITSALKLDGRTADTSGVPAAGALDNVERDLTAMLKLAASHKIDATMIEAFLARHRRQRDWVLQRLEEQVLAKTPDAQLAFLGFDAAASALLDSLPKLKVRIYDPAGALDSSRAAGRVDSALEACAQADAVVVFELPGDAPPLDPGAIAATMRGKTVVDPYRAMDPHAVERAGLIHHVLGRAP